MALDRYHERRNFERTGEPRGAHAMEGGRRFVVQLHDARRRHFDFRLEDNGVLKSWAVPKGPSLDPQDKRLAVETEDHPIDYADFEGVIPAGEYGAGPVLLWDRGTWEPIGDVEAGLRKGHLKFHLKGQKLRGNWVLVRRGGEGNWLLIKERDEAAAAGVDLVGDAPASVKSGQELGQIAAGTQRGSGPCEEAGNEEVATGGAETDLDPAALENVRRGSAPISLRPELATQVERIPGGDDWLHEIKYDGYRMLCHLRDGKAKLLSRNGKDWTGDLAPVASAAEALGLAEAVLDGELVALRSDGTSDFQALQNALKDGGEAQLVYYAFDLPFIGGYDVRRAPLLQRKRLLQSLLEHAGDGRILRYTEHARGQGPALYDEACRRRLEGLISKRVNSTYVSRRTRDWQKTKCAQQQEFVIGGYTDPAGSRQGFGALLVGINDERGRLRYAGRVGTGFSEAVLGDLAARLRAVEQEAPPFDPAPERPGRGVHWVRPTLVAEVRFAEWTGDGHLRQPSFLGLREDKDAGEVRREQPADSAEAQSTPEPKAGNGQPRRRAASRGRRTPAQGRTVCGVTLTHPERVLYPEQNITKAQLAEYYAEVADAILPHVAGRPLSLVRCPQGHAGQCFYQKHLQEGAPEALSSVTIQEKSKRIDYGVIEDAAGLVALAQMGVLEIHPWGARADQPERPDRLTFDLDPGEGVAWREVVRAAREVATQLEELGLRSFVKTTGGKGLHVVVPLQRRHSWDELKQFAGAVARSLAAEAPDRYLAKMSKQQRRGRVFIDYLRNGRGATAVAPYSTRARPAAPVATPLRWDELGRLEDARRYTLENVPGRLRRMKDSPWQEFFEVRQSITAKARRRLGLQR